MTPSSLALCNRRMKMRSGPTKQTRTNTTRPLTVIFIFHNDAFPCSTRLAIDPATITPKVKASGEKAKSEESRNLSPEAWSGCEAINLSFNRDIRKRNLAQRWIRQNQPKRSMSSNGWLTKTDHQPAHVRYGSPTPSCISQLG